MWRGDWGTFCFARVLDRSRVGQLCFLFDLLQQENHTEERSTREVFKDP